MIPVSLVAQISAFNLMTWTLLAMSATDATTTTHAISRANTALASFVVSERLLYQTVTGAIVVGDVAASPDLVRGRHPSLVGVLVCGPAQCAWMSVCMTLCAAPRCPSHPQAELFMHNGCYESSNTTACGGVLNGLFSNGLHAVTQYYANTVHELLAERASANMSQMTVQVSVHGVSCPSRNTCLGD